MTIDLYKSRLNIQGTTVCGKGEPSMLVFFHMSIAASVVRGYTEMVRHCGGS